jgi:branched-chain amino acid transport system permease protein
MDVFLQLTVKGLLIGFGYALGGAGVALIYRSSKVVNFAHGGLFSAGAFLFLLLSGWTGLSMISACGLILLLTLGVGSALALCFARRPMDTDMNRVILLTLGLALMFNGTFQSVPMGRMGHITAPPLAGLPPNWGAGHVPYAAMVPLILGGLFLLVLAIMLRPGFQGISLECISEDEIAARTLGLPVGRIIYLSWALGAILAALGGLSTGMIKGLNVEHLNTVGLIILPVFVLGGLNHLWKTVLAGLAIGLLETLTREYVSPLLAEILPYIILLGVLGWRIRGRFEVTEEMI